MLRLLTQTDKEQILEYLKRNEVETSFLYANVIEFGVNNNKEIRRCADYFGYFEGESLKGILPFYNLGSCIPHYEALAAIPLFVQVMKERAFDILLGMEQVIRPLYEGIKDHKTIVQCDESAYYVNNDFNPFRLEGVNYIDASKGFDEEILEFIVKARLKGFNHSTTKEEIAKVLTQKAAEEDFILLEKEGKIIAQACVQTYTEQINQIGNVYTMEEERGKGYCKAVVSEICRRIVEKGKIPTLAVSKMNTPAVKAYSALGFQYYNDYLLIKLKTN